MKLLLLLLLPIFGMAQNDTAQMLRGYPSGDSVWIAAAKVGAVSWNIPAKTTFKWSELSKHTQDLLMGLPNKFYKMKPDSFLQINGLLFTINDTRFSFDTVTAWRFVADTAVNAERYQDPQGYEETPLFYYRFSEIRYSIIPSFDLKSYSLKDVHLEYRMRNLKYADYNTITGVITNCAGKRLEIPHTWVIFDKIPDYLWSEQNPAAYYWKPKDSHPYNWPQSESVPSPSIFFMGRDKGGVDPLLK